MIWRRLFLVAAILLAGCAVPAAGCGDDADSDAKVSAITLLPAPEGGPGPVIWGYVDKHSHWVIEPQFEDAQRFHEWLAVVKLDGKFG